MFFGVFCDGHPSFWAFGYFLAHFLCFLYYFRLKAFSIAANPLAPGPRAELFGHIFVDSEKSKDSSKIRNHRCWLILCHFFNVCCFRPALTRKRFRTKPPYKIEVGLKKLKFLWLTFSWLKRNVITLSTYINTIYLLICIDLFEDVITLACPSEQHLKHCFFRGQICYISISSTWAQNRQLRMNEPIKLNKTLHFFIYLWL